MTHSSTPPASTIQWSRNVGKYRIQRDLLAVHERSRVLDVGAVGVGPLDLWRALPLRDMPLDVVAVDNDSAGVERARSLGLRLDLQCVSGYDLVSTFGAGSFDVVVSTQVLEHVARPAEFVAQIAQVLKPNGQFWCSLDSGHFSVSHAGDKLWKRAARPVVSRLFERFHDFGLTEDQVRRLIEATDMRVEELLHCNLGPVKPMASNFDDTRIVDFMPLWCRFEEELAAVVEPSAFRDIYVRAVRNPEPKG
ncbi:MAG TPA: methyltransferase domain-containing protein [Ilumatobacter sp.]|nr:methyltransferase domain-containing protein [Ilumatobacter sp.]